jgi:hypothetical protein
MSSTSADNSHWPKGVEGITYSDIGKLGVDRDGRLHWDGKPVEVQRRLRFSRMQTIGAVLVGLAAIIGGVGTGINEGFDFGCKVHWWAQGCSR